MEKSQEAQENSPRQIKRPKCNSPPNHLAIPCTMTVSVEEAITHFKALNLPMDSSRIHMETSRMTNLLNLLRPPQKLTSHLSAEVNLVHSLSQTGLDWTDKIQFRILQTLFKKLTGSQFDCMKRGIHWQQIGFQGNDPATDLRSLGLFGLLQFLSLTSDRLLPLGKKLYRISVSEAQQFPLAVLSLNISNIVLNLLNSGKLNKEFNSRNSVLEVLNSLYAALLIHVYNALVTQKKTIKEFGLLLKEAERYCGKNLRRVLKELPQSLLSLQ